MDFGDSADVVLLDREELTAMGILPKDKFIFDAGGDPAAAGRDDLRYYVAEATGPMEILDEDEDSDWGTLSAGTKVVPGFYYNLVYGPNHTAARWYTPSLPHIHVNVPVEHIVHARFKMAPAELPPRPNQRQREAVSKGAVVLSEADNLQGMDGLMQL